MGIPKNDKYRVVRCTECGKEKEIQSEERMDKVIYNKCACGSDTAKIVCKIVDGEEMRYATDYLLHTDAYSFSSRPFDMIKNTIFDDKNFTCFVPIDIGEEKDCEYYQVHGVDIIDESVLTFEISNEFMRIYHDWDYDMSKIDNALKAKLNAKYLGNCCDGKHVATHVDKYSFR